MVHTNPNEGPVSDDYRRLNRLGRIPTFQGSDGYVLTEVMAIAIYRTSALVPNLLPFAMAVPLSHERRDMMNIIQFHFSYPCLKTCC